MFKNKTATLLLIISFVLGLNYSACAENLTIKSKAYQLKQKYPGYTVEISYPQFTGSDKALMAKLNSEIRHVVDTNMEKFMPGGKGMTYQYTCTYDSLFVDPECISFNLGFYNYTGGAHGFSKTIPFNCQLQPYKKLQLSDLLGKPVDYKVLSDLCRLQLYKTLKSGGDADFVKPGTEPKAENFADFVFDKKGLQIIFQPYQVAPYCEGAPSVSFTYGQLQPLFAANSPLHKFVIASHDKSLYTNKDVLAAEVSAAGANFQKRMDSQKAQQK